MSSHFFHRRAWLPLAALLATAGAPAQAEPSAPQLAAKPQAKADAAQPFRFSLAHETQPVKGEVAGRMRVAKDAITFDVDTARLFVTERMPASYRRRIESLRFTLATSDAEGKTRQVATSAPIAVGKEIGKGQEVTVENAKATVALDKEKALDLSACWVSIWVQMSRPEEGAPPSFVFINSARDIFKADTPTAKAEGTEFRIAEDGPKVIQGEVAGRFVVGAEQVTLSIGSGRLRLRDAMPANTRRRIVSVQMWLCRKDADGKYEWLASAEPFPVDQEIGKGDVCVLEPATATITLPKDKPVDLAECWLTANVQMRRIDNGEDKGPSSVPLESKPGILKLNE